MCENINLKPGTLVTIDKAKLLKLYSKFWWDSWYADSRNVFTVVQDLNTYVLLNNGIVNFHVNKKVLKQINLKFIDLEYEI